MCLQVASIMGFAFAAARAISREREARTLPVLLTTPWEDREIIAAKAQAVFWLGLPLLAAALASLSFSSLVLIKFAGRIGWALALCAAGLYLTCTPGIVFFVIGLGLYCGVRLKTAGAAAGAVSVVVVPGLIAQAFLAVELIRRSAPGFKGIWRPACVWAICAALVCGGAGWVLLRLASRRLRRDVF